MIKEPSPASGPVLELAVQVTRREVLRNLGYPRAKQPAVRVRQCLDAIWPEAVGLLRPRGLYWITSGDEAAATGMPDPTPLVGLGLCTIGVELEEEEGRLAEQGQMLEALVLDAFGSAAAEATADALNLRICQEAQERGYQLPPRVSPGYGKWRIEGQRRLLGLLGAEALKIQLTDGLMMVPRKSISFGVCFLEHAPVGRLAVRRCALCELKTCAYRAEPAEPDEQSKQPNWEPQEEP